MTHFLGGGGGGAGGGANLPVAVRKLFFSDGSEIRETLMQYVSPTPAVTVVHVPGDVRVYLKRSNRARRATSALVVWFCDLHGLGYSLVDVFTQDGFGVDHLGCLRGNMSLLPLVRQITTTGVSSNMAVVADIIHTHIHSSLQIPEDLAHLLKRLKQYDISFSPLVRSHASHEEEDIKSALFVRMHSRLKFLEKMNPTVHGNILQVLQQIPDASVWLRSAMLNTHLHIVLRYTQWKGKYRRTLGSVVYAFLTTKVHYVEDATGLLTCRRNGQAHIEADSSVDTIGYIEAALFGAADGLRTYHQLQYNADLAAAVQQQPQVASIVPLATRLLMPMPSMVASVIGQALQQFLSGAQLSMDAAKAGAIVAANNIVMQPNVFNRAMHVALTQNAVAAAMAAAQALQGGVAQASPPIDMFNANDIDHMYHVIAPRLLVGFQRVMFGAGECFRLGEDTKVPRLTL